MEHENAVDIVSCLKSECEELKHALEKRTVELESAEKSIDELTNRIRFMEGKIEAYRDCLNIKR